ncbi:hypothetical protein RFI_24403 [Reticulomyxa filosa]|uniref:Cytochrome b561 domain-containing protein n=1 Tax=Reticulomyxa filosa TaxID=46433 RepID=X6MHS6_RETFI|nr:hypothetical protein RFI_24403 [Reticulomyxa filosa]|eukprot:ETO12972.1 hypothetical protein RFI_24403 [Reticulomyxa filosa]
MIAYVLAWLGFFAQLSELKSSLSTSMHAICGYILLLVIGVYSVMSGLYCFRNMLNYNHINEEIELKQSKCSSIHSVIGYALIIFSFFTMIVGAVAGSLYLPFKALLYLYLASICVTAVCLECMYRIKPREKAYDNQMKDSTKAIFPPPQTNRQ